jgi:hypothetical protein
VIGCVEKLIAVGLIAVGTERAKRGLIAGRTDKGGTSKGSLLGVSRSGSLLNRSRLHVIVGQSSIRKTFWESSEDIPLRYLPGRIIRCAGVVSSAVHGIVVILIISMNSQESSDFQDRLCSSRDSAGLALF